MLATTDRLVFAPTYGSPLLRDSSKSNIINVRGSFFDEVSALMHHLNEQNAVTKAKQIGIIYEEGTIGKEVEEQLKQISDGVSVVSSMYNGLSHQQKEQRAAKKQQ